MDQVLYTKAQGPKQIRIPAITIIIWRVAKGVFEFLFIMGFDLCDGQAHKHHFVLNKNRP